MAEDSRVFENELHSLSQKQLVEIAKAFDIPDISDATDKPIIVRNILKGVGFKYTTHVTRVTVNPPPRPVVAKPTAEQLYDMLKMYAEGEIMLLRAVASMLETLKLNAELGTEHDSEAQVAKYAYDLAHELEYFQAHTSHARFVSILRLLRPQTKLDV